MHYHIKDILSFIRKYDNTGLFTKESNTKLRKYIRACLEKDSFYFIHDKAKLIGLVEWYRVTHLQPIIDRISQKKYLNSNPTGKVIWVNNMVFKPDTYIRTHYQNFINYHKNATSIMWWRFKYKRLKIHKIASTGGI